MRLTMWSSVRRALRAALPLFVLTAATAAAQSQGTSGTGVVVNATPMYLLPDATRTPMVTLPAGTQLRVITKEGDWYRVVFRDRYLGERTGYVLAANIRFEAAAPDTAPAARTPMPGAP